MADTLNSHFNQTVNDTSWMELISRDPGLRVAHLTYLLLGVFVTCFGFVSLIVKDRLYMSEAMVATLFGIIIGPVVANIFNPDSLFPGQVDHVTLEFSRLIIAIQCLVAGITLPGNYLWKERKSIAMLLGPVMLYMWLMSALAIWAVFSVPWQLALVIAGCITPTDPVLANSIVKGKFAEKHIPYHVRLLISAESAINDGLGVPLVFLPVYLWRISNTGEAIGWWILNVIIYQITLCVIFGILIGYASLRTLKYAELKGWIDKESIFGFFIAIALFTTGSLSALGVDDILGCFFVGTVLSWDQWFNQQIEETHIQEVLDVLINIAFFIYFGTLIPWSDYTTMIGTLSIWKLFLVAIWLLLLRRLPVVMLLRHWIPALGSRKEAFFCGWFGPIGAGAIFYCMTAVVYLEIDLKPMFPIISFIVLSSILLHGASVGLFEFGITRHSTWQNNRLSRQISTAMRNRQPVVLGEEQTESDHGNNDERGGDRSGSGGFQPILAVSELNVSKSATESDAVATKTNQFNPGSNQTKPTREYSIYLGASTAEMDLETGVGAPVHSLASSSIPSVENNISTSRKLFHQSNTTSAESDSPPPASLHRSDASDAILNGDHSRDESTDPVYSIVIPMTKLTTQ
ncbi:Na+/H+ antiporter [Batrachochytrium dendrobatidis]|nr:Na+/H+ antiporter [Batrachochytrium dendrobatidis]KAK5669517.1 Na+/H+ antiporter [Batrachochytrium dendrobatidis]